MGGMNSQSLHDFMDGGGQADFSNETEIICSDPNSLTENQVAMLEVALNSVKKHKAVVYDAFFDISGEISDQLSLVHAMRRAVINDSGTLAVGCSPREIKEVAASATTLIAMISKHHDRFLNFDRMAAIESATAEAVKTLPEDTQKIFFTTLERKLEAII